MKIEFASLMLDQFKEFREPTKVSFSAIGLGVTYVRGRNLVEPSLGSNGAGKSTIWAGLMWCLFGRDTDGLRGPEMKTWGSKGDAYAKVVVYVEDVKRVIERSTQTNGLWLDGAHVEQGEIDRCIGMSLTTFENAIVMGQAQPLFFDMKATEKLNVLSDAIDLDRWQERSKAAAVRVRAYDQAITTGKATVKALEDQLVDAKDAITKNKAEADAWEKERAAADKLDSKARTEAEEKLERAKVELGKADDAYDYAETELRDVQTKLGQAQVKASNCEGNYAAFSAALLAADDRLKELNDEAKNITDECPTCGASLRGPKLVDHKRELARKIKAQENICDAAYRTAVNAGKVKSEAREKANQLQDWKTSWETKSNDAVDARTRAQTRVSELKASVEALQRKDVAKAFGNTNPFDAALSQSRKQKVKIEDALDEADKIMVVAERKRGFAHYWVDGFKTVRLYLLQEVLDELQAVTNSMLPRVGLEGWEVEYAMDRETKTGTVTTGLTVHIRKPGFDKPVRWEAWSGGEGQRLRIAGAVALSETLLRRAGVECDLMVMDEPTRHMSPEGVADLVDFLVDLGADRQVFYIDHAAMEDTRFASVMTVTRTKDGSRIAIKNGTA